MTKPKCSELYLSGDFRIVVYNWNTDGTLEIKLLLKNNTTCHFFAKWSEEGFEVLTDSEAEV